MGIPDEESWFRTGYLPTGRATGWRRGMLTLFVLVLLLGLVVGVAIGLASSLS